MKIRKITLSPQPPAPDPPSKGLHPAPTWRKKKPPEFASGINIWSKYRGKTHTHTLISFIVFSLIQTDLKVLLFFLSSECCAHTHTRDTHTHTQINGTAAPSVAECAHFMGCRCRQFSKVVGADLFKKLTWRWDQNKGKKLITGKVKENKHWCRLVYGAVSLM